MILINPRSTKFGIFDKYIPLSVPIGIGYLAATLLANNKRAKIIDEHIDLISKGLLKDTLKGLSEPYVFGISTLTACVARSYEIASLIKNLYPKSKIVLGGIHPTVLPEEVLGNSDIDFVVRGEGENIVVELYDAIKNNKDHSRIKGISFRASGKVVNNPEAEMPDLKRLPAFPYHLFDKNSHRYNFSFIASSRGCPYKCIFCSQRSISGQQFRYIPTNVVIDEIDMLINKYGQAHINFVDDNFTINKTRVAELCEAIIGRRFHDRVSFDCQTRADAVDDEILDLLKKAGFRLIDFGIETASERLMILLNKKETVQDNIEAVRSAKKHGFGVSGTFIFGLPSETRSDRTRAYRLAKELDLDYVRFNNATPYPGTVLYDIAKKEGRLFIKENWSNLNACASLAQDSPTETKLPYVPLGCDEKVLRRDIVKANLFFSLRPKRILKLLVKRVGPAGWFYLRPKWYLNPREWLGLIYLGYRLLKALVMAYVGF
ncbi:MAG: radical SAM protein [Candidatus Omnitrophota bacterium]